ncbi:putative amidohydrolase [Desulfocapsa sulfexigens DSM 10523]|uniref:Putative amidohydrolase n=1 Tax=Desulfocapsa sulfexigens (strain DSM 10523 / SB164P1) TaxID=1167006 RepID=M1P8E0_DESSD|nr:carbon-nitrogen hydrolase family protein [Desulfocapsa sulfexigens]AGF77927.1 putative amidohydrolase [Desulfocapsa sulfexigens DSM 10523]
MIINTYIKENAPGTGNGIRLAVYQGKGPAGTPEAIRHNTDQLEQVVRTARQFNAQLISFPELYLSGYAITPETAQELAMETAGPELAKVAEIAKANDITIICPYPEKATVGGKTRYYDSIAVFDINGFLLKNYRKTHLWGPDEKKIWNIGYELEEEGEAYSVFLVNDFPVAVLNCYEAEFPELARILALKGAKLIVIPTAADESTVLSSGKWTTTPYPDVSKTLIPAHAYENNIFISYSNRCQEETLKGKIVGKYLGNSMIANCHGELMVAAKNEVTLLLADCIPANYGPTHPENTDYLKDRRASLYRELVKTTE